MNHTQTLHLLMMFYSHCIFVTFNSVCRFLILLPFTNGRTTEMTIFLTVKHCTLDQGHLFLPSQNSDEQVLHIGLLCL